MIDEVKENNKVSDSSLPPTPLKAKSRSLSFWEKTRKYSLDILSNKNNKTQNVDFCMSSSLKIKATDSSNDFYQPKKLTLNDIAKNDSLVDGQMTFDTCKRLNDAAPKIKSYNKTINNDDYAEKLEIENIEQKVNGFGWIRGVLIRCVLCIFGATLFLRMSWIAGQAGVLFGTLIVLLSFIIVMITSISMSAIATNGEVKTGGIYYMISRSLGPEFGGSIGLILYIANTINASMNCVGLAESLVVLLKNSFDFSIFKLPINDVRLYALLICLILQLIIFIGTEFENKTQMLLLITIMFSFLGHFVGTFLPITDYQSKRGIVGYSWKVFMSNMMPNFGKGIDFITLFGIYFPAMTGVMAGANMSGDLRDPSKSIPKGTFWSIAVTTIAYSWCMFIPAATILPNASGNKTPVWNDILKNYDDPLCAATDSCKYGLRNDFEVMTLQSAFSPIVTAGIFATTLSSASGCLIGAPRIFQALCEDELFPFIKYFAKGHGLNNEPFRAYFFTFFIACGIILIGKLDAIAILITNFFLAAFSITNFACFDASTAHSPGFRPGFHYYNRWLSLFGAILCISIMFLISKEIASITFLVFFLLFIYLKNMQSNINWGSSTEANRYRKALTSLLKMTQKEQHVKNYRPQVLVLTGNPAARKALIDFADCICNGQNLMLCGHIVPHISSVSATAYIRKLNNHFTDWLYLQNIKAFYCAVADLSLRSGVQTLLQTVGIGKMQPNILLLGYNNKWISHCVNDRSLYDEYCGVISDAFENNLSVCVFRNQNEGLDHSSLLSENESLNVWLQESLKNDINSSLNDDLTRGVILNPVRPKASRPLTEIFYAKSDLTPMPNLNRIHSDNIFKIDGKKKKIADGVISSSNKFRTPIRNGVVDVWWLFDDGGLTLLLSYLLTTKNTYLPNAKMRIFTICSHKINAELVQENLRILLNKFRIQFTLLKVFVEDNRTLYPETINEYSEIVKVLNASKEIFSKEIQTSTEERTFRYLRHRELLVEHSSASSIIIITLPLATPSLVCSPVYMLWLELLSRDLPPTLFVRGNQTSVITYYS